MAAEIMDPYASDYELLARAQPPSFDTGVTIDEIDAYLRAIGALPPRTPAAAAAVPNPSHNYAAADAVPNPSHNYAAAGPLWGAVDVKLPATWDPYAAASDDMDYHAQRFLGASEVAFAPLAQLDSDDADMDYHDTAQGGQTEMYPVAPAVLVRFACEIAEHYGIDAGTVYSAVLHVLLETMLHVTPSHGPDQ